MALTKRQKHKKEIMRLLGLKQNVMLIGPGGIGKTTMLREVISDLGDSAYYVESPNPPKSALKTAFIEIGGFHEDDLKEMKFSSWTVQQVVKELIKLVEGRDFVLALDSLDRITVSSSDWLKELAESGVTILGAARKTKEEKELLDRFFWTAKTITLQPLSDREILEIIKAQVNDSWSPIKFKDKNAEHFFGKTVVTSSKGIPIVAIQMCQKARGMKEVSLTFVREELMTAHKASVKYIDLTPLILIAIGLIGALRYIGRGMGNQELYIIAGTLTAAAIIIRVLMPPRSRQRKA